MKHNKPTLVYPDKQAAANLSPLLTHYIQWRLLGELKTHEQVAFVGSNRAPEGVDLLGTSFSSSASSIYGMTNNEAFPTVGQIASVAF